MNNEDYMKTLKNTSLKGLRGTRIIIAGGGTGGHVFPAIAIANALKKLEAGVEILFVGAEGKMEMQKVPEAGYNIVGLYIAGYNRSSLTKNITLPFKLLRSFMQVTGLLRKFKPDAVIGVGGYSSFPMLRLAQTRKVPTFIHESNSLPGRSNKILSRRATKIFVASDSMNQFFPADKIIVTGNPVRSSISNANILRGEALQFFGLKPEMKTVFVMGGSLGARSINNAIAKGIYMFKQNNWQLIWQTGKLYAETAAKVEEEKNHIWTNAFIDKIEYAYAAADVVISRSGSMAIAELCIVGKPVIFVPYPYAAEDHQVANALALVKKNAALMIKDSEVDEKLIETIQRLIKNENLILELRENIAKMGNKNADEVIAAEVLKQIND